MKRILLVDDQAHVLRVIKLSLDRNGFEVDTALSGEIALKMLREANYNVVITDIDMPILNGQELCEAIQREFVEDAPLCMLVVADGDEISDEWLASIDRTELVEKPMSLRWLVSRLNEYFGHFGKVASF